jgi:hypothetical protein
MAIYHLSMKTIQRSAGRSAVASSAYRSGEKLNDPRQGLIFDYKKISDRILDTKMFFPKDTVVMSRQDFWGGVELHHKRGDAVTAREIEVALPHELKPEQIKPLLHRLAGGISDKYGVGVDVAVHRSDGKDGNLHAHIMMSACSYTADGFGKKCNELDPIWCKRNGVQPFVDRVRPAWEKFVNEALEKSGFQNRIDHRSLDAQGIERSPQLHVGPRGRMGRDDRMEYNARILKLYDEKTGLETAIANEIMAQKTAQDTERKRQLAELSASAKKPQESALSASESFELIIRLNSNIPGKLTDADVKKISYAVGLTSSNEIIQQHWTPWVNEYMAGVIVTYDNASARAKTPAEKQRLFEEPDRIKNTFVSAVQSGVAEAKTQGPKLPEREKTLGGYVPPPIDRGGYGR